MFVLIYQVTGFRCSTFKENKNATSNKKNQKFCIRNL